MAASLVEATLSSLRPGETVLGTEECDQLNARRVREQIDGAAAQRVQAGVIGDQADVLAAQRSEFFGFENVEAELHASGATRSVLWLRARASIAQRRPLVREGQSPPTARCAINILRFSRTLGIDPLATHATTMILWNVRGGLALFT